MSENQDAIRELAMTKFKGGLFSAGVSVDVNVLLGNTVANWGRVYSASDAVTVKPPQGLSALLGKYNDDPTWEGFDEFLQQHDAEIDRINR